MKKVRALESLLWMAKCNKSIYIKEYEDLLYREMRKEGLIIKKEHNERD